jgi:hypothetical protein
MGLDMYLEKKTYVKNWEHMTQANRHKVEVTKNGELVKHIKPERISYVIEEAGYWRKANQIHKWFEDKISDGEMDNCRHYYVSREALGALLDTVNKVLDGSKLVAGRGW